MYGISNGNWILLRRSDPGVSHLFLVWLSNADKGVRLISSTDAFAEYFPVSQGQVAAALGPDTTRQLQPDEVDSFIAGLKTLLAPPATGTE